MPALLATIAAPQPIKLAVKPESKVHLAVDLPEPLRGQTIVPACFPFTRKQRNLSLNQAYGYRSHYGDISEVTCIRCQRKPIPG